MICYYKDITTGNMMTPFTGDFINYPALDRAMYSIRILRNPTPSVFWYAVSE